MRKLTFMAAASALSFGIAGQASALGIGNNGIPEPGDIIGLAWSFPSANYVPDQAYPLGIGSDGGTQSNPPAASDPVRPTFRDVVENQGTIPIPGGEEFGNPALAGFLDAVIFKDYGDDIANTPVTIGTLTSDVYLDMRLIFEDQLLALANNASQTYELTEAETFLDIFTNSVIPGWGIALDAAAEGDALATLSRNNQGVYQLGGTVQGRLFTADSTPTPNDLLPSGQDLPFGILADPDENLTFSYSFGSGRSSANVGDPLGAMTFAGTGEVFLVQAVPEPATIALLGLGLAGAGFARRRAR
jgi:hypothetical protein